MFVIVLCGHIRYLPKDKLNIDKENQFEHPSNIPG